MMLWTDWRRLVTHARLISHHCYILIICSESHSVLICAQLKEFANFDFDVWRKRYMRWMNHKKSRVMDFFRRIDKDQDGKVTRQEFIEGILSSSKKRFFLESFLNKYEQDKSTGFTPNSSLLLQNSPQVVWK